MVTEAEAKTKWCPFARVVPGMLAGESMVHPPVNVAAHNRVQEFGAEEATWHSAMLCIGSKCMAWRKLIVRMEKRNAPFGVQEDVDTGKGFCGLAGKP